MNLETIKLLYEYNWTMHRKVWQECIVPLSEAQFTQPLDYSIGSIHAQVVHVMSAEWIWLSRMQGNTPKSMFHTEDYPTRDHIRARWDEIESDFRAFLDTLTDEKLIQSLDYQSTQGIPFKDCYLNLLLHLMNHGTDHRAQILAMIHHLGGKTIAQDLLFYLRSKDA